MVLLTDEWKAFKDYFTSSACRIGTYRIVETAHDLEVRCIAGRLAFKKAYNKMPEPREAEIEKDADLEEFSDVKAFINFHGFIKIHGSTDPETLMK